MNFSKFFENSWNWLFLGMVSILLYIYGKDNKKLDEKLDKSIFLLEKENMILEISHPLEIKMERLEIYLKLLMAKAGIDVPKEKN